MLQTVKLALRITTDAFDSELNRLIAECIEEMTGLGITIETEEDTPTSDQVKGAIGRARHLELHINTLDEYLERRLRCSIHGKEGRGDKSRDAAHNAAIEIFGAADALVEVAYDAYHGGAIYGEAVDYMLFVNIGKVR